MIYVRICPSCKENVSFLNNEDKKECRNCGIEVTNTGKQRRKRKNKNNDTEGLS